MCCLSLPVGYRIFIVFVTALSVVGLSAVAQDARRKGGNQGQDPRVRDPGNGAQQGPPPLSNASLKGVHANGGIMLQDGDQAGVIPIDRSTEIIINGEADASFVTPGALVEVSGTLEGPRGPISSAYVVVLRSSAKNAATNPRLQSCLNINPPKPGENRPTNALIRGPVVSANPLVVAAGNQKMPIRLDISPHYIMEIVGGDPRTLCKEGDKVDVTFQPVQGRNAAVARTIVIRRTDPFNAGKDDLAGKDVKRKDEQAAPEKVKKTVKGKPESPAKPRATEKEKKPDDK